MDKILFYYYECEYWDGFDQKVEYERGLVGGASYADAVNRIESIHRDPKTRDTDIIAIYAYEIDSFDGAGIALDDEIKSVFEKCCKLKRKCECA